MHVLRASSQPELIGIDRVTEIYLSDGRMLRLSLHIDRLARNAVDANGVDISYQVITEVMAHSNSFFADVHETPQ